MDSLVSTTETAIPPTLAPTSIPPSPTSVPPTGIPVTPITPLATPAPTSIPCNWAQFVTDVNVQDGTFFTPEATFTKVWRLRNIGSCTWTVDYDLSFVDGDRMEASSLVPLPHSVRPGETVDVSVRLVAPEDEGLYRGDWGLRSADGAQFGIGDEADESFWVEIEVVEPEFTHAYDFANNLCDAHWSSGAGVLNCQGKPTDDEGFVQMLAAPRLENGQTDDEPTLLMHPEDVDDGFVRGEYPVFKVQNGDRFASIIGCLVDNEECQVVFRLSYRDDDGDEFSLKSWEEIYDEEINRVEVDLSDLADQSVEFILTVEADGSADQDNAFWLTPRIER
jgi:hypothetical protein